MDEDKAVELIRELREDFLNDRDDNLYRIEEIISLYPQNPLSAMQSLRHAAHNIKGAAQLCNLPAMSLCLHTLEEVIESVGLEDHQVDERFVNLLAEFYEQLEKTYLLLRLGNKEEDVCPMLKEAVESIRHYLKSGTGKQDVPTPVNAPERGKVVEPNIRSEVAERPFQLEQSMSAEHLDVAQGSTSLELQEGVEAWTSDEDRSWGMEPLIREVTSDEEPVVEEPSSIVNGVTSAMETHDAAVPAGRQECLLCLIESEHYGFLAEQVIEIIESRSITPLPHKKAGVLGLIGLRGEIVPVINFAEIMGFNESLDQMGGKRSSLLIYRLGKDIVAIPIDSAVEMIPLDRGVSLASLEGCSLPSFVKGLLRFEQSTVRIIEFKDWDQAA